MLEDVCLHLRQVQYTDFELAHCTKTNITKIKNLNTGVLPLHRIILNYEQKLQKQNNTVKLVNSKKHINRVNKTITTYAARINSDVCRALENNKCKHDVYINRDFEKIILNE